MISDAVHIHTHSESWSRAGQGARDNAPLLHNCPPHCPTLSAPLPPAAHNVGKLEIGRAPVVCVESLSLLSCFRCEHSRWDFVTHVENGLKDQIQDGGGTSVCDVVWAHVVSISAVCASQLAAMEQRHQVPDSVGTLGMADDKALLKSRLILAAQSVAVDDCGESNPDGVLVPEDAKGFGLPHLAFPANSEKSNDALRKKLEARKALSAAAAPPQVSTKPNIACRLCRTCRLNICDTL